MSTVCYSTPSVAVRAPSWQRVVADRFGVEPSELQRSFFDQSWSQVIVGRISIEDALGRAIATERLAGFGRRVSGLLVRSGFLARQRRRLRCEVVERAGRAACAGDQPRAPAGRLRGGSSRRRAPHRRHGLLRPGRTREKRAGVLRRGHTNPHESPRCPHDRLRRRRVGARGGRSSRGLDRGALRGRCVAGKYGRSAGRCRRKTR